MGNLPTFVNAARNLPAVAGEERSPLLDGDASRRLPFAGALRALTTVAQLAEQAETEEAEAEAVRRSVAAQFPIVAAFLAEERAKDAEEPPAVEAPARSGYDKPTAEDIHGTHARAPWCTASHEDDEAFLSDVCCFRYYDGSAPVPLFWPGEDAGVEQTSLLSPVMDVRPFSDTEARCTPVVNVAVIEDHVVEDMGPAQLEAFIATVRAQCDRLDGVLADLIAARAAWNAR
ncbi:DUF6907 domain-containing protein [Streptomyces sp. NRRL F-5630]|uniref:DUF6907 domain-containing protein n=1 Tax=Streptomyces sp. NRRL F-5630 TaxID=1463864 RepID=UPI003EBACAB9